MQDAWEDWIPQVVASINDYVNVAIGKIPLYMFLGLISDYLIICVLSVLRLFTVLTITPQNNSNVFAGIYASVREKFQASKHKSADAVTVYVGDSVMKRAPERH